MKSVYLILIVLCWTVLAIGCASTPRGPYSEQSIERRNPTKAAELNSKAADLLSANPAKAEELLREALTHDLYYGPAHNNLDVLFLARGDLYEASGEFEWARKLMPGHPDPRLNLAITLERGGQVEEAMVTYESVLELRPEFEPAMVGLVSLQLQYGKANDQTAHLLGQIARVTSDEPTRSWALAQPTKLQSSN